MLNTICKSNDTMSIAVNAVYAPPYYKEKPEIIDRFFKNLDFVKHNFNYHLGYPSKGSLPKHIFESMPKGDTSLLNWQDKELLGNSSFASFKETTAISSLEKIHNRIITNYQSDIVPQNGCCVAGYRRLYVTTTGKFLACERIGNSPILGDVDRGIDLDVVYSKYIFDYSNKWLKYCNDCWSAKICSTCFVDKMDVDGVKDPDIDECNIVRFLNIKNLSRYHYLLQKYPYKLLYLESADFMGY